MNHCPPKAFFISLIPCPHGGNHGFVVLACSHESAEVPVDTRDETMRVYRRLLAQGFPANPDFKSAVEAASFLSGDMPEEEVPASRMTRPVRPIVRLALLSGRGLMATLRLLRRWRGPVNQEELPN